MQYIYRAEGADRTGGSLLGALGLYSGTHFSQWALVYRASDFFFTRF